MARILKIKKEDGQEIDVNVVTAFEINDLGKKFIVYKTGEKVTSGGKEYTKLEAAEINNNQLFVIDETIWAQVKAVIQNIVSGVE